MLVTSYDNTRLEADHRLGHTKDRRRCPKKHRRYTAATMAWVARRLRGLEPFTDTMRTNQKSMFLSEDGSNLLFTFILVSSLFLLWGVCNGMIDVMDKHFQEELGLTKSQSAWVQFAHYLGYFLMSMPAGWLASKLGYKAGIIAGLLIVALGGFWFIPATHINALVHEGRVSPNMAFVAFLAGVCAIATGLTFLETIANPYTTVLGARQYAATRINLAQSCNGVGWIFGPIIGSMYFLFRRRRRPQHRQPDALHSLRGHRGRRHRSRRHLLLRQDSRHQNRRRLSSGRFLAAGFALHLVASAFRVGGGRAVLLRGRPGRHFQLLHQLHDRRSSRHSSLLGRWADQARGALGFPARLAAAAGSKPTRRASSPSATRALPTWRRWALCASWWAASPAPAC